MSKLKVHKMFNSIQTEGIISGRPAYFISLSGCNLKCSFCDTKHKKGKKMSVKKILKKVDKESCSRTVILTGGEPMIHDATTDLVNGIIRMGWAVQVETNGTVVPKDFPMLRPDAGMRAGLVIVCSPKTKNIHPEVKDKAACFKYIIGEDTPISNDGLPEGIARPSNDRFNSIMLSPMLRPDGSVSKRTIDMTLNLCLKYEFYMSYQWHKPAGIMR